MLSQGVQAGIDSILALLSDEDLQSLAVTLTKGHIAITNRQECRDAILAFTESGEDFLHRRVCSKTLLVQYAYAESMSVTAKLSKEDIIKLIVRHWSSKSMPSHKVPTTQVSGQTAPLPSGFLAAPSTIKHTTVVNNYTLNYNHNVNVYNSNAEQDLDRKFGEEFTRWFYNLLNHHDPVSQGFGPSSFLPGVTLKTIQASSAQVNEEALTGCDSVAHYFLDLFNRLKLVPNLLGDGIRTKSDPHGLRMILVCGTVYRDSALIGVFQQSFGLVQDPALLQNWRIQFSELRLKEMQTNQPPQLQDFSDVPEIEMNTIKSLQLARRN